MGKGEDSIKLEINFRCLILRYTLLTSLIVILFMGLASSFESMALFISIIPVSGIVIVFEIVAWIQKKTTLTIIRTDSVFQHNLWMKIDLKLEEIKKEELKDYGIMGFCTATRGMKQLFLPKRGSIRNLEAVREFLENHQIDSHPLFQDIMDSAA